MKKSLLIIVSIIIIIIIVNVFATLFGFEIPFLTTSETPSPVTVSEPTVPEIRSDYPMNLIEGKITKIEKKESKTEFTIEARVDKIFLNPPSDTTAIVVSADKNTETFIYDMGKQEKIPTDIASFQIDDQVLIGIVESNRDIITETSYTAIKIDKMILEMGESN